MNILIIHGPNLNLLGEAPGERLSYAELNARVRAFAAELGATVKIVQSNHEGVLIDTLQAERSWADAILINPAALTHTSYALRECLRLVRKPAIEVHLEDIRRRETWRRKSVIKDVCEAQVMGRGLLSYLDGLERLATGRYNGLRSGRARQAAGELVAAPAPRAPKTLGRGHIADAVPSELLREAAQASPERPAKTLGRGASAAHDAEREPSGITRELVRQRIADRLGNRLSAGALALWAREQWLNLERGAAAEVGQRELLEEALQTLATSASAPGQLGETELIDWMARLA